MDAELFAKLPNDCISEIVSFTSPVDAAVFSVISKRFKASSESDVVWNKFLPFDIDDYISRSSSSIPVFPTKKDLFLFLSNSPVLLNGGRMSFSLDKKTGKKCFFVAPRELTFAGLYDPDCFRKVPEEITRFGEIAGARMSDNLREIRGRISCQMLSDDTQYACYLVYNRATIYRHYIYIPPVKAICRFVKDESREAVKERASLVSFDALGNGRFIHVPRLRPEWSWSEVEIGSFFNVRRNRDDLDDEVESIIFELNRLPMYLDVIVQGIEFRPKPVDANVQGDMDEEQNREHAMHMETEGCQPAQENQVGERDKRGRPTRNRRPSQWLKDYMQ